MGKLVFTQPHIGIKEDLLKYQQEHFTYGEHHLHGSTSLQNYDDIEEWLQVERANRLPQSVESGLVSATTFVLFDDQTIIGMVNIRHRLNDHLRKTSGHIGYGVAPSKRRQGYATELLRYALDYCQSTLQLKEVLLTCNKNNAGSRKTIVKCKGRFEQEVAQENGEIYEFYWIDL